MSILTKCSYIVILLGALGWGVESVLHKHDEAFVQEHVFPMQGDVKGSFQAKHDAKYKVVVAFRASDQLTKLRSITDGGDAYERSENLGRRLLEGIDVKVDGANPIATTFSIFGGAPAYERTNYTWDPHASYQLATFNAKRDTNYTLLLSQNVAGVSAPAYVMVRMVEASGTHAGLVVILLGVFMWVLSVLLRAIHAGALALAGVIGLRSR